MTKKTITRVAVYTKELHEFLGTYESLECAYSSHSKSFNDFITLTGELEVPDKPITIQIGPFEVTGINRDIKQGEKHWRVTNTTCAFCSSAVMNHDKYSDTYNRLVYRFAFEGFQVRIKQ